MLFNHMNKILLAEPIRWSCCDLRGHWEHQTNFNQQQTTNVRFLTFLIIYCDSWRESRFWLNIKHPRYRMVQQLVRCLSNSILQSGESKSLGIKQPSICSLELPF
jgi:hypothetical protein